MSARGDRGVVTGPPTPFDPEVAAVLAAMGGAFPSVTFDNLHELRQGRGQAVQEPDLERGGRYKVSEVSVPGPAGDVVLLVAMPVGAAAPVAAIYNTHGGGMIMGDRRFGVVELQDDTERLDVAIVSVEYRLAPETRHPGPVEDCYTGLVWLAEHADELGIDPDRIIVGGASAGGGLAAALALMARDRRGPRLLAQLLICPMLDDRNDSPSAHQMRGLGVWDQVSNRTGWTALLGEDAGGPGVSPYAAPARATDLSGLPPAFIDVGSAETFRDEDIAYASRIWQAGGQAELHVWPGGCHGFEMFAPHAALSADAKQARRAWLRRVLAV